MTKLTTVSFNCGKGRVMCLGALERSKEGELRLGWTGAEWMMPRNASDLTTAVFWAAHEKLPLEVKAPE